MRFGKTFSIQPKFPSASIVEIETDIQPGIFFFTLIGLADISIRESRSRILAAIKNSGFKPPKARLQKITTLLRPAGIKKFGSIHDLGIAISYLLAQQEEQIPDDIPPKRNCFLGELTLEGKIVSCQGITQAIVTALKDGFDNIFYPSDSALAFFRHTATHGTKLIPVSNLVECFNFLNAIPNSNDEEFEVASVRSKAPDILLPRNICEGLILALGGGHHTFFFGEPGTGKTFATNQIGHVVTELTPEEQLERSLLGLDWGSERSIRRPHSGSTFASLLGNIDTPGEILKAHRGVLVMNEFAEFDRRLIETLRQPLEESIVTLSRSKGSTDIACNFTLIATSNICPCGYFRSQTKKCSCAQTELNKYQQKLSGPILDRFEIRINTNMKNRGEKESTMSLAELREKIALLTTKQFTQTKSLSGKSCYYKNLPDNIFWKNLSISKHGKNILDQALARYQASPRLKKHLWSLAKSYSDLRGSEQIEDIDVIQALRYRLEDPKFPLE